MTPECAAHARNRMFPDPVVREMLRALGVTTCPRCHRALAIATKRGWVSERPR